MVLNGIGLPITFLLTGFRDQFAIEQGLQYAAALYAADFHNLERSPRLFVGDDGEVSSAGRESFERRRFQALDEAADGFMMLGFGGHFVAAGHFLDGRCHARAARTPSSIAPSKPAMRSRVLMQAPPPVAPRSAALQPHTRSLPARPGKLGVFQRFGLREAPSTAASLDAIHSSIEMVCGAVAGGPHRPAS